MTARTDQTAAMRGACAYQAGLAAEEIVARDYARRGVAPVARRWRGRAGEIDLIARDGTGIVFVEVKTARSHDAAALRVSPRQIERIFTAAEEFLGTQAQGSLTDIRFDLALVDGAGRLEVRENAFAA